MTALELRFSNANIVQFGKLYIHYQQCQDGKQSKQNKSSKYILRPKNYNSKVWLSCCIVAKRILSKPHMVAYWIVKFPLTNISNSNAWDNWQHMYSYGAYSLCLQKMVKVKTIQRKCQDNSPSSSIILYYGNDYDKNNSTPNIRTDFLEWYLCKYLSMDSLPSLVIEFCSCQWLSTVLFSTIS